MLALLSGRSRIGNIRDMEVSLLLPVLYLSAQIDFFRMGLWQNVECEERRHLFEIHLPFLACEGLVVSSWGGLPHKGR